MSKFKILWIDDKWEEIESFKDLCELPENGMEITPCRYSVEGMRMFEERLEEWSGVILDAKVLYDSNAQIDQLKGLTYSISKINELKHRRAVPYFIFTGQPDTASGTSFAEEHGEHYYEKDKDEDRLIADIKAKANALEDNQIIHKYQQVFETWPNSRHDLLRVLRVIEDENWTNNSVLNDIRKIMSDVMHRFYDRGLLIVEHNDSNLGECSRMLGDRAVSSKIPVYIQRSIHSLADVTNPGSHRSDVDSKVANNKAPYLLRSLIYEMLNVLHWANTLPSDKAKCESLRREMEQLINNKRRTYNY